MMKKSNELQILVRDFPKVLKGRRRTKDLALAARNGVRSEATHCPPETSVITKLRDPSLIKGVRSGLEKVVEKVAGE